VPYLRCRIIVVTIPTIAAALAAQRQRVRTVRVSVVIAAPNFDRVIEPNALKSL
jgi:hypothetical protein